MYFNTNIKILRQRKNRTQDIVANELGETRSTLNSYENGSIKNPTLDMLIGFSKYFKLSIDTLVKVDLSKLSDFQLSELEKATTGTSPARACASWGPRSTARTGKTSKSFRSGRRPVIKAAMPIRSSSRNCRPSSCPSC